MPLVYERAFGGFDTSHKKKAKHQWRLENPIGAGFSVNRKDMEGLALPNLEAPGKLISHWKDKPPVMGFGFIDSAWEPRVKHAGTYDEEWENNQSPLPPMDFNIEFFSAASRGLKSAQYLRGGEPVELINLSPKGELRFNLPSLKLNVTFRIGNTDNATEASLWTILFEPDEDRFYLVWGQSFPVGKQLTKMRHAKVEIEGGGPFSREKSDE